MVKKEIAVAEVQWSPERPTNAEQHLIPAQQFVAPIEPPQHAPLQEALIRSATLYFASGDVALSAKNPLQVDPANLPRTVFRVDKAYVERQCDFLAKLFQSPAPGHYDGVPMYSLPYDTIDIGDILAFIYNPAYVD